MPSNSRPTSSTERTTLPAINRPNGPRSESAKEKRGVTGHAKLPPLASSREDANEGSSPRSQAESAPVVQAEAGSDLGTVLTSMANAQLVLKQEENGLRWEIKGDVLGNQSEQVRAIAAAHAQKEPMLRDFQSTFKNQKLPPRDPTEEGDQAADGVDVVDPWQEWRRVRDEDEESDVDLGEEESNLKDEQLEQFEDLQLRVMSVIEAERKNKKAVTRNHKAVVAAHKQREADLMAEIVMLKEEAVEMRATIASLSDEVSRLENVECHLLQRCEREAMRREDIEHIALRLKEHNIEAEEARRRAEMARASFERELRELRNEIRSACEGVEEPLVMLRSLLGELCDKLRFDFADSLDVTSPDGGEAKAHDPTTRLVMANIGMFGELGSLVESLRGMLLLLGGLVGRPGADADDMPARELLSGAVTWAIGSSLPNCFAEVKGACESVTATAAAMAERTSSDGHAMQMLGEENNTLRERLSALEHFELERDEAWAKVEVLQREVDNLLLEKKGMEERLSNQMATMEKMVDERIQVCNAMVKLQADQEAGEQLKREATNMRADIEQLELSEHTLKTETKKQQDQLQHYTTKCMELTEAYQELENTCLTKQQRLEDMIEQRAQMEMQMKPLQNLRDQLTAERESLKQQLQEKNEQADAGKAEMLALQQKLQAQVHVIDSLTSGSNGLQAKMQEQGGSMQLLNQQAVDAARELSDSNATVNRMKESLEEISGKERYKTQVNERLIAERAQLDHQIAVLKTQLESAELEKGEAVVKLKEQVHVSEQLASERQQLLRQLKQESETINKLSGVTV